jgi:hypothetical protein
MTEPMSGPSSQPPVVKTDGVTRETAVLCPYCGHVQSGNPERCAECGGIFEPLSRRATQISMGPWFIRDKQKPFMPGCSFEVLRRMIRAGRIRPTTVMRGPTTRQFWTVARNIPGVGNLLGYCHACNAHVAAEAKGCRACGVMFPQPGERNELGLMYPTEKDAQAAQKLIDREREAILGDRPSTGPQRPGQDDGDTVELIPLEHERSDRPDRKTTPAHVGQAPPPPDLLSQVLGPISLAPAPQHQTPPRTGSILPPPAPVTGRTPANPGMGAFENFNPAEDLDEAASKTSSLPKGRPQISALVWALISLNVLLLIGAVVILVLWLGKPTDDEGKPKPDPSAQLDPAPSLIGHWIASEHGAEVEHLYVGPSSITRVPFAGAGGAARQTSAYRTESASGDTLRLRLTGQGNEVWTIIIREPGKSALLSRGSAEGKPLGDERQLRYVDALEQPATDSGAAADPNPSATPTPSPLPAKKPTPELVVKPTPSPLANPGDYEAALAQAAALEAAQDYEGALNRLQGLAGPTPRAQTELRIAMDRLQEKVQRRPVVRFFLTLAD